MNFHHGKHCYQMMHAQSLISCELAQLAKANDNGNRSNSCCFAGHEELDHDDDGMGLCCFNHAIYLTHQE